MSDVLSRILGGLLGTAAHAESPRGDVPSHHADSPLGTPRLPGNETARPPRDEAGRFGGRMPGPWAGGPAQGGGLGGGVGGGAGGGFGDLGGMLGGLLGGLRGGAAAGSGGLLSGLGGIKGVALVALLAWLMRGRGGAQGLGALGQTLQGAGLGPQFDSWVGEGENRPLSPSELERALPPGAVEAVASETGLGRDEILSELSRGLPQLVDRLTPQGHLPQRDEDLPDADPDDLLRGFGIGPFQRT